jgi:hypothetical protein
VRIQEHYQFRPDWYRLTDTVRVLVGQYYVVLRSVLRQKPELRRYHTCCRHCGIHFLCDARNHGRRDLGCPFGCQQAYRRQRSAQRSADYYQSDEGKAKKKFHNGKRGRKRDGLPGPRPALRRRRAPPGLRVQAGLLDYLSRVVSLIEGRRIHRATIRALLQQAVRQHSMGRRRRIEYLLQCWAKHGRSP